MQLLIGVALPLLWRWSDFADTIRSLTDRRGLVIVVVLGALLAFGVVNSSFEIGAIKWLLTYVAMFIWALAVISWCGETVDRGDAAASLAAGMFAAVVGQTIGGIGSGSEAIGPEADLSGEPTALLTPSIGTQSVAAGVVLAMAFNLFNASLRRRLTAAALGIPAVLLTGSRTYLVAAALLVLFFLLRGMVQWVVGLAVGTLVLSCALLFYALPSLTQRLLENVRGVSVLSFLVSDGPGPGTWQFRVLIRNQAFRDWLGGDAFDKVLGAGLSATNQALRNAGYSGEVAGLNSGRIVHNTVASVLLCLGVVGVCVLGLLVLHLVIRGRTFSAAAGVCIVIGLPLLVENPLAGGATVAGVLFGMLVLVRAPGPGLPIDDIRRSHEGVAETCMVARGRATGIVQ